MAWMLTASLDVAGFDGGPGETRRARSGTKDRHRRAESAKGRAVMHMHPMNEWMMDRMVKAHQQRFIDEAERARRIRGIARPRRAGWDVRRAIGGAMVRVGYWVAGAESRDWIEADGRLPSAG